MLNNMLDLLRADGSIVVNKRLAKKIGLDEAIIYSELASQFNFWSIKGEMKNSGGQKSSNGEWFFCTVEKLEEHTTIKKGRQLRIVKSLESLGLIETKIMGLPSKRYFRITEKIFSVMFDDKIQVSQNGTPDNINVSAGENSEEARFNQVSQNGTPRSSKTGHTGEPKRDTINNRSINNKSINKLEEEEGPKMVIQLFKENFKSSNPAIEKELAEWTKKLPIEVISNEIEFAAMNGARSFSYLQNVLNEDHQKAIDSTEKLVQKRLQYKAGKKKHRKSSKKPVREELIPSWLVEQQKDYETPKVLETANKEVSNSTEQEISTSEAKRRLMEKYGSGNKDK